MKIEPLSLTVRQLCEGYADHSEDGVVAYGGKLDIRPKYQREFIYSEKQQQAVVNTAMHGWPLNTMYWAVRGDGTFEVIDGQQRTLSLCRYGADATSASLPADAASASLPADATSASLPKGGEGGARLSRPYDPAALEREVARLMADDDVTRKSGIYEYLLSGGEREGALSIRKFTDSQKRAAYERQGGKCVACGKSFAYDTRKCTVTTKRRGRKADTPCRTIFRCSAAPSI